LRPETEWIETVEAGCNVVVGSDHSLIVEKTRTMKPPLQAERLMFGDLNFHDALIASCCRDLGVKWIATFDSDFDQITWLKRLYNPEV